MCGREGRGGRSRELATAAQKPNTYGSLEHVESAQSDSMNAETDTTQAEARTDDALKKQEARDVHARTSGRPKPQVLLLQRLT